MPHPSQRGVEGDASALVERAQAADGLYYKIAWKPAASARPSDGDVAIRQSTIVAREGNRRRWVVLADRGNLGLALAPALAAFGDAVIIMDPHEWRTAIQCSHSTGSRSLSVHDETNDRRHDAASESNLEFIYLGALDEEDVKAAEPNLVDLEFLRQVAATKEGKVWLVTKGAVNVRGPEDVTSPGQAALWGLGRTFAREHSSIWGGLLDLDPMGDTLWILLLAVVDTIRADDGEDQIVWRDGSRRVARLVPDLRPLHHALFSVRPDRAYLITGGLGGDWTSSRGLVGGQRRATSRACWTYALSDNATSGAKRRCSLDCYRNVGRTGESARQHCRA